MSSKKLASVLSIMVAVQRFGHPEEMMRGSSRSAMSFEDKQRASGLKEFKDSQGRVVWAINQKNADKKFNKL